MNSCSAVVDEFSYKMNSYEHGEDDVRTEIYPDEAPRRREGDQAVVHAVVNRDDSRVVLQWKMLTLAVLLSSTVGMAVATYLFTSSNEQREFETRFCDDANKILGDLGTKIDLSLGAVDALVVNAVVS